MIRKPNFKLNWKYALGELVLIFLGISLAITFQNWNDERKAEAEKVEFFKKIRSDLVEDQLVLGEVIQRHKRYDSLLSQAQLGNFQHVSSFGYLNALIEPRLNETTFKAYQASGKLDFLNSDLGMKIQSHYLEYLEWESNIDFFNNKIKSELRTMVNAYTISPSSVKNMLEKQDESLLFDPDKFQNIFLDEEFQKLVMMIKISSRVCQREYIKGLENIETLIHDLNEYLNDSQIQL